MADIFLYLMASDLSTLIQISEFYFLWKASVVLVPCKYFMQGKRFKRHMYLKALPSDEE